MKVGDIAFKSLGGHEQILLYLYAVGSEMPATTKTGQLGIEIFVVNFEHFCFCPFEQTSKLLRVTSRKDGGGG
jgi:hypothetical protein